MLRDDDDDMKCNVNYIPVSTEVIFAFHLNRQSLCEVCVAMDGYLTANEDKVEKSEPTCREPIV